MADLRAATPSNAAELAVPDQSDIRDGLSGADVRLSQAVRKQLTQYRFTLRDLSSRRVLLSPTGFIDQRRMELDGVRTRLAAAADGTVTRRRAEYIRLCSKLDALSPLKVLGRGYAIALTAEGAALRDSGSVDVGDQVELRLEKGALACRVEEKR